MGRRKKTEMAASVTCPHCYYVSKYPQSLSDWYQCESCKEWYYLEVIYLYTTTKEPE